MNATTFCNQKTVKNASRASSIKTMISVRKVMRSCCLLLLRVSRMRAMKVTTRVEIRFWGKSLQKKKRRFSAFEISSALEPSQLRRERRQKQQQRQKQRQIRVVFFIVLRVESFRCPTTTANEEKRRFV